MAGVNKFTWEFALSDPFFDNAEPPVGGPGMVASAGIFTPHVMPHPAGDCQHFDAGNASHDYYLVTTPSPSPGGILALPDYYIGKDLSNFTGQNCPPEFIQFQGHTYSGQPIFTEVEYAVIICPELPFKCATIWAYRGGLEIGADMWTALTKCNYGREGNRDSYAFYFDPYGNPLFDGSAVLGNDPSNLAFFGGDNDPAGEFYPYLPMLFSDDSMLITNPNTGIPEYTYYHVMYTKYYHNNGLDLDIDQYAIAIDDTMQFYGLAEFINQDFIITNTGGAAITDLRLGMFLDYDLLTDLYLDSAGSLPCLDVGYQFNTGLADRPWAFGIGRVPTEGRADRFLGIDNTTYLHPNAGWGWDRDSLWNVMNGPDWDIWGCTPGLPNDASVIMASDPFSLDPAASHTEAYIFLGDSSADNPQPLCEGMTKRMTLALKMKGFFRGDVNMVGCGGSIAGLELADAVYLANYLLSGGPAPKPYPNMGDVDGSGAVNPKFPNLGVPNIGDQVYLSKYLISNGAAPVDYPNFQTFCPFPAQPSLFLTYYCFKLCP